MGSPIVFHTAPPQPASKARITWSPQFVGGPDASQKGFGQRMPAKLVVRSATSSLQYGPRGAMTVRHGVDHFPPAVDAIASRVVFRIAGATGGPVHGDHAALHLDAAGI